jgi:hypothetical protein
MSDVDDVPEGFVAEWVVDFQWRTATAEEARDLKCRRTNPGRQCPGRVVALLNRGLRRSGHRYDAWWPYCADHLYGRRIAGSAVLVRHLRRRDSRRTPP